MTATLSTRPARIERAHPADLEVRTTGRTLVGIIAPFGERAEIVDRDGRYVETIAPTAFDRTIAERGAHKVKVLVQHEHGQLPIGRASVLRPERRGVYGELKISKTAKGDEVLELVRDGALDGLSIGFVPIRERWSPDRSVREITELRLEEVSVVAWPAYQAARIEAVRAEFHPSLNAAYQRLQLLRMDPPT